MLNQEQLAAIAAAMSLVHQTLQQTQQQSVPDERPKPSPPEVVKTSQPISYSAVVAKSAGLTSNSNNGSGTCSGNNINNINQGINKITTNATTTAAASATTTSNTSTATNGTAPPSFANNINDNALNSMSVASHNKLASLPVDCDLFGGLNHPVSGPPFSASSNHLSGLNGSDPLTVFNSFNGINTLNGHSLRSEHLSATNPIARYSINHIANHNTDSDIFNTHIAGGLGHSNGSSLLTHHNSNTLMAHEPTLDNYAINHPTIPAHQLYNQQNHSYRQNQMPSNILQLQQQQHQKPHITNTEINIMKIHNNSRDKKTPTHGRATNLLGFMGLYVGNLSPDLTKEQLEKIFSKYGEPVKAHRLIRSPVAFIKYENTESPRAAIDDLFGILLPDLTLNQDQPLKLHFDRNDAQLKANYRPTELPKDDNGECYGWRTTVCRRGKSCTKKHIPINRGIDFQMWMIKTNLTTVTGTTTS